MRNKLPAEVLHIIFSFSNYNDLFACQKVCQDWNQPARVLIYKCITLYRPSTCSKLINSLKQDLSLGKLVKSFEFCRAGSQNTDYVTPKELLQLAMFCPGVECLLTISNSNERFWRTCYFLCLTYWTRLAQLPEVPTALVFEDYLATAIACRNHLENLKWYNYPFPKPSYSIKYMTQLVRQFKKLKSISLQLYSYTDTIYTLDSLLNQCGSNLSRVDLNYVGVYREFIQLRLLQQQYDISNITPLNSMKQLYIRMGHIDIKSLNYIKQKFPQLNNIKLSFGPALTLQQYTDTETTDIIQYAMSLENSTIKLGCNKYARFLELFRQQVRAPGIALSIVYEDGSSLSKPVRLTVQYNNSNSSSSSKPLQYEEKQSRDGYLPIPQHEPAKVLAYCQRTYAGLAHQPHAKMLSSLGTQLTYLFIDIQQYSTLDGDSYTRCDGSSAARPMLDTIFEQCPNLHTLAFSARHLRECDENFVCNNSIRHLAIFSTEISDGIFPQLSTRLPSLTYLQLTGCHIYDVKNDTSKEFTIDMPYTVLQWLSISERHYSASLCGSREVVYVDYFSRKYLMTATSHLKVSTIQGEKYFKAEVDKVTTVPLQTYQSNDALALTRFHLRCKSIQSINIQKGGLSITNLDPNTSN